MENTMKRFPLRLAALVALPAALGLAAVTYAAAADTPTPQSGFYGPCPGYAQGMGPGWGKGPGRGAGWQAMGPAARGGSWRGASLADANHDGNLTVEEVKTFLETRHDRPGFENLKIGAVKEKDVTTLTAEMVTAEGALVRTLEFPRKVDATVASVRGRGGFGPGMRGGRGGWGHGFAPARQAGFDGRGFGPGMRAGLMADGQLSVDEVKGLMERHLTRWNNPNLKVGEVREKDAAVISADIVTKDGSLVEHMEFDRKSGFPIRNR
jgi:hypothetical protein